MPPSANRGFRLREAAPDDLSAIVALIYELADYEKLRDQCHADEASLREHLFGERRYAEVIVAEIEDEVVGYALFFHNYSTFRTQPGIYLEDLFVRSAYRHRGIGKALLARLIELARERGCGRVEWLVLDWNEPAIGFYKQAFGAQALEGWTVYRVSPQSSRAQ